MIQPMLCEPSKPFDSSLYLWEIKWDGERALIFYENGKITIQNRKGNDVTFRYPELQNICQGLNGRSVILDGEICGLDENGKSVFSLIAQRSHLTKPFDIEMRSKKIPVTFIAFDLLSLDNTDVKAKPLRERKELLYKELTPTPPFCLWSLSLEKDGNGTVLFQQAEKLGLEGIVGKLLSSPYLPGKRSPYWIKCKCEKFREMYFNKYTVNNAGIRVEDENEIAVQVSGHQSEAVKKEIDEKGKVLIEVKYLNVTENGRLRMPTFKRMV